MGVVLQRSQDTWALLLKFCFILRDPSSFFALLRLLIPPPLLRLSQLGQPGGQEGKYGDERGARTDDEPSLVPDSELPASSSAEEKTGGDSHDVVPRAGVYVQEKVREQTGRPEKEASTSGSSNFRSRREPRGEQRPGVSAMLDGAFRLTPSLARKMLHLLDVHLNRSPTVRLQNNVTSGIEEEEEEEETPGEEKLTQDEVEERRRVRVECPPSSSFPTEEREAGRSGDSRDFCVDDHSLAGMLLVPSGVSPTSFQSVKRGVGSLVVTGAVPGFSFSSSQDRGVSSSSSSLTASFDSATAREIEKTDARGDRNDPLWNEDFILRKESLAEAGNRQVEGQARKEGLGLLREAEEREEMVQQRAEDLHLQKEALYWLQVSGLHSLLPKIVEWTEEECSRLDGYLASPTSDHGRPAGLRGFSGKVGKGGRKSGTHENNSDKKSEGWGEARCQIELNEKKGEDGRSVPLRVVAVQIDLRRVHPLLIQPSLIEMSPWLSTHFEAVRRGTPNDQVSGAGPPEDQVRHLSFWISRIEKKAVFVL